MGGHPLPYLISALKGNKSGIKSNTQWQPRPQKVKGTLPWKKRQKYLGKVSIKVISILKKNMALMEDKMLAQISNIRANIILTSTKWGETVNAMSFYPCFASTMQEQRRKILAEREVPFPRVEICRDRHDQQYSVKFVPAV